MDWLIRRIIQQHHKWPVWNTVLICNSLTGQVLESQLNLDTLGLEKIILGFKKICLIFNSKISIGFHSKIIVLIKITLYFFIFSVLKLLSYFGHCFYSDVFFRHFYPVQMFLILSVRIYHFDYGFGPKVFNTAHLFVFSFRANYIWTGWKCFS